MSIAPADAVDRCNQNETVATDPATNTDDPNQADGGPSAPESSELAPDSVSAPNSGDGKSAPTDNVIDPKREKLHYWLNKTMKIKMTDGRTLIGVFMCTDKDRNVILGNCQEYLKDMENREEDARILGLAMVPGHHIVNMYVDEPRTSQPVPTPS